MNGLWLIIALLLGRIGAFFKRRPNDATMVLAPCAGGCGRKLLLPEVDRPICIKCWHASQDRQP